MDVIGELTAAEAADELVKQCQAALLVSPHRGMTVRLTIIASLAEQVRTQVVDSGG